jgi:hypothetical protein
MIPRAASIFRRAPATARCRDGHRRWSKSIEAFSKALEVRVLGLV